MNDSRLKLGNKDGFETYLQVCAACQSRAHTRTGDAAAISGNIGKGETHHPPAT